MRWQAQLRVTAFTPEQIPPAEGPEIAFVGRSNVGKSTLLNGLMGQKLAHVSSKPGKTRSINFYSVEAGRKFTLVDLPGFGYAALSRSERESWNRLIGDFLSTRGALRLIVHLVDIRHGLLAKDVDFQEWSRNLETPVFVVFTKADKISSGKRSGLVRQYVSAGLRSWDKPLVCSNQEPKTIEALRNFIETFLDRSDGTSEEEGK